MRIACVSDTHLQRPWIPDADILIHAGDLSTSGSYDQVAGELEWLRNLPHRHKIVIAGNHDWLFQREPWAVPLLTQGLIYLQDECVTIDGLTFYGSPYTPYWDALAFNIEMGRGEACWARMPHKVDVLVTHGPPMGVMDQTHPKGDSLGCAALKTAVCRVRPKLHVFGHIHPGYGRWDKEDDTTFVNAAHCRDDGQGFNPPIVIDL